VAVAYADFEGTVLSIEHDSQAEGIAELLPVSLRVQDQYGETINYYVRNTPEMAEVVANPQRYTGQRVRVFAGRVLVTLRGQEMWVNPAFRVELMNKASSDTPTSSGGGDEATIRGSQDDVLDVYVTKRTIPGDGPSTYQMQVQNVHRGKLRTGQSLEAFWDGAQPKVGNQYIIMGRVKDGWFHVDPTISYPYTHEKASWIFNMLRQ
jgi:hypothetical protein